MELLELNHKILDNFSGEKVKLDKHKHVLLNIKKYIAGII